MIVTHELPPLSETKELEIRRLIVDFWNGFSICDDLSGTLRELLREMEIKVTDLLGTGQGDDVYDAWRITIRAACLVEDSSNV